MAVNITRISSIGGHITTYEAARILNVRPDYVYKLVKRGELACIQIGPRQGGTLLFRKSEVEELAETRPNLGKRRAVAS